MAIAIFAPPKGNGSSAGLGNQSRMSAGNNQLFIREPRERTRVG